MDQLRLPLSPQALDEQAITPGCALLSEIMEREMGSERARLLLLAIAWQETRLSDRLQIGAGGRILATKGRGFWQFERTGIIAILNHSVTVEPAKATCAAIGVPALTDIIHQAVAWCDPLAAIMARLLLWADVRPLPEYDQQDEAYAYYLRTWRPGKPRPDDWPESYATAQGAILATATV